MSPIISRMFWNSGSMNMGSSSMSFAVSTRLTVARVSMTSLATSSGWSNPT
jgi:hypothetical protein